MNSKKSSLGNPGVQMAASRRGSLFEIPAHPKKSLACGSSMVFRGDPHPDDAHAFTMKKPQVEYENTFKMEPPERFQADKVKHIIRETLDSRLEKEKYDPIECGQLAKVIAQEIKDKAKALGFQRYKLVCTVNIGSKNDQGLRVGSRFVWDTAWDNYATGHFENSHIFAVAMLYAVYYE